MSLSLTPEAFHQLSTSEALHTLAELCDGKEDWRELQWIVKSPLCSEATAFMLFWKTKPQHYLYYKLTKKNRDWNVSVVLERIHTILTNFQNGVYQKTTISFAPPSVDRNLLQQGPDFMLQWVKGEEPYLYYTEREVNSWFGELLENKMRRFDDTNELYNLAYYVKSAERVPLILQHPFCDKRLRSCCSGD